MTHTPDHYDDRRPPGMYRCPEPGCQRREHHDGPHEPDNTRLPVRLTWTPAHADRSITVAGHDLSSHIRSVTVNADGVECLVSVTLSLPAAPDLDADVLAHVEIAAESARLLQQLGWTPPAAEVTP